MRTVTVNDRHGINPGAKITVKVPRGAAVMHASRGVWGANVHIFMGGRVVSFYNGYPAKALTQVGCRRLGRPAPFPKGCRVEMT